MARRMLSGHFEAFFWGQEYGGTQEAVLVALLLLVRVPRRWAMEMVPIGLHLGSAVLVWRIGLRTVGRRAAVVAAGICWAASPALLWWSTKERGFYGFTLVCGLVVLLLVLRLARSSGDRGRQNHHINALEQPQPPHERGGWLVDPAVLGVAAGLGWWASPQILHFVVPGGLWLAWSYRRDLLRLARLVPLVVVGAVVGALPWLWANAHTGLASLASAGDRRLFGNPFDVFFRYGVPMVLGLRAPITLGWEFVGARIVYAVVLLALTAVIVVRPKALRPILLVIAAYPLIFAVLPTTYYYGEPRYLDFLWPLLALVAGWALAPVRWPVVQALVVVAVLAVTANGVAHMTTLQGPPGKAFEDMSPHRVAPLVHALDAAGIDRTYADYWVAYRLGWETDERIVSTPLQLVRSARDDRAVGDADRAAFVVVAGTCLAHKVEQGLEAGGVPFTVTRADDWAVIVPAAPVTAAEVVPEPC